MTSVLCCTNGGVTSVPCTNVPVQNLTVYLRQAGVTLHQFLFVPMFQRLLLSSNFGHVVVFLFCFLLWLFFCFRFACLFVVVVVLGVFFFLSFSLFFFFLPLPLVLFLLFLHLFSFSFLLFFLPPPPPLHPPPSLLPPKKNHFHAGQPDGIKDTPDVHVSLPHQVVVVAIGR